ncbi:hypothetical protein FS837_009136, partial [Tulasnella sp. UAMH 9824]
MESEALDEEPATASRLNSLLRQPFVIPTEIWVEIFMLSLPPIDLAQAPQKTSLTLVCRLWNAIVEATPTLWSRITIVDTIPYVRKSLSKSGECPIDINGAFQLETTAFGLDFHCIYCQFIQEVQLHSHRWRHVALQVNCTERFAPSAKVLPLLESLKLYSNRRTLDRNEYSTLLDRATTPHLREVLLHAIPIAPWDIALSSSLLKLDIRNTSHFGPPSVPLFSILAACPNLTVLRLRKILTRVPWQDNDVNDPPGALPIVKLAALQELTLDDNWAQVVKDLLQQLRIPEECTILLKANIYQTPSTSFLDPVVACCHGGFQRDEGVERMTIGFTSTGFCLLVPVRRWKFELRMRQVGAIRDALHWFGIDRKDRSNSPDLETGPAASASPNNIPVLLKFAKPAKNTSIDISSSSFIEISDFECITKIKTIRLPPDQQLLLLLYLSRSGRPNDPPSTAGSSSDSGALKHGTTVWPFPGLCELLVKGLTEDVVKAVIEVVTSRSGGIANADDRGGPARLKRIEFRDERDETMGTEERPLVFEPAEPRWNLLLELLEALGEEAK